jgi:LysR family transcriptional regulator, benzoate and cis,cis-muconate-responsive activator of ben and cat genes
MAAEDGIELVHSFIVVAEELNFRRGAERLHVDQSALSRRIQRLEHLVGVPLLERTTREVALTAAGRVFYSENTALVGTYARSVEMARAVFRGHAGSLTVTYMSFAAVELMPRTVARYRQLRPQVSLNLRYARTHGQKVMLAGGESDVGYLLGPLEHDKLDSVRLLCDPLCVVAPETHEVARMATIRASDIAAMPLVLGDMAEWGFYRDVLARLFERRGIEIAPAFQASNTLGLLGLVRAGMGVTILPESLRPALHAGLVARRISEPEFTIETVLAWRRGEGSTLVREFVETAARLGA